MLVSLKPLSSTPPPPRPALAQLHVPELRVGTLDSLLAVSDELSKASAVVESIVGKFRRQLVDLDPALAEGGLKVHGQPIEPAMTKFVWDEAKHPVKRPLKETIEKLQQARPRAARLRRESGGLSPPFRDSAPAGPRRAATDAAPQAGPGTHSQGLPLRARSHVPPRRRP